MKPAILLPAEAPSVYFATRMYAAMGLSVLPCAGKKPALSQWAHLQKRVALAPTIDLWHKTGLLENVGIICGAVSGGLVVMDFDGEAAFAEFSSRFPDLLDTYTVRSGSGHGYHLYYYVLYVPPTTRVIGIDVGNIELRSNGAYVVAPPSIHPDSHHPYVVHRASDIAYLHNMRPQVDWIKSLIQQKHGGTMPPAANASKGAVINNTAYGRAALAGECVKVRSAVAGARNHTLFEAALRMGSLIHDGKISGAEVEQRLFDAAHELSAADGEAATRRTIASGIERGLLNSRDTQGKRA